MENIKMKFENIQTKEDAYQYATDWHLPKVPFFRMWNFNCQNEKKCVKLALALQSIFNGAKENNPFKIKELIKLQEDMYLVETSVGNFELNYQEESEDVKVEKSTRNVKEEKEKQSQKYVDMVNEVRQQAERKEQQEVAKVEKSEKKGFSLRLFGKEILGWN